MKRHATPCHARQAAPTDLQHNLVVLLLVLEHANKLRRNAALCHARSTRWIGEDGTHHDNRLEKQIVLGCARGEQLLQQRQKVILLDKLQIVKLFAERGREAGRGRGDEREERVVEKWGAGMWLAEQKMVEGD